MKTYNDSYYVFKLNYFFIFLNFVYIIFAYCILHMCSANGCWFLITVTLAFFSIGLYNNNKTQMKQCLTQVDYSKNIFQNKLQQVDRLKSRLNSKQTDRLKAIQQADRMKQKLLSKQEQIKALKQFLIQKNINPILKLANQTSIYQKNHLKHLVQALKLLQIKQLQFKSMSIYFQVLQSISKYYLTNKLYQEFITVNKKILESLQFSTNDKQKKGFEIMYRIGNGYFQMKKYDQAISFYQKSLKQKKQIFQKLTIDQKYTLQNGQVLWNIGYCYQQKSRFYMAKQYFRQSMTQLIQAKKIISSKTNKDKQLIESVDKFIQLIKMKVLAIQEVTNKNQL